jgi:hypothetical protein
MNFTRFGIFFPVYLATLMSAIASDAKVFAQKNCNRLALFLYLELLV